MSRFTQAGCVAVVVVGEVRRTLAGMEADEAAIVFPFSTRFY